jgi:hypothetical protein
MSAALYCDSTLWFLQGLHLPILTDPLSDREVEQRLSSETANFTEAARDRNIEAGILLTDSTLASALRSQFDLLIAVDIFRRVPGL